MKRRRLWLIIIVATILNGLLIMQFVKPSLLPSTAVL
jgi:hypothetical protein